jgi:predicted dehydrogenase
MSMDNANSAQPLRVGLLGAGMIATVGYGYLPYLAKVAAKLAVVAIADPNVALATAVARAHDIAAVFTSLEEMLGADLDAVVNLTPIPLHFRTSKAILESGRHLVTEKPLSSTMGEADELIELAERKGLLIVAAPADMIADEWATARRLVSDGAIGKVAFARVQSSHAGPAGQGWPVDPTWFYQEGSGPLLDMGVYGLTQVTGVLGPAKRVMAMSGITTPVRTVRGGPFAGLEIAVAEPDNNLVMLDFGGATFAVVDGTFNVVGSKSPRMEIFGLGGTLIVNRDDVPAPPVEVYRLDAAPGLSGWITPKAYGFPSGGDRFRELQRGALIEHLADCVREGSRPVPSAYHARHVLEIMLAARHSAADGIAVDITTTF